MSPGGSDNKEFTCNAGDPGLIPGSERYAEEGNGNPLQYSCLEIPWTEDRGVWQATFHGVTRVGHNLETKPLPTTKPLKPSGWGISMKHRMWVLARSKDWIPASWLKTCRVGNQPDACLQSAVSLMKEFGEEFDLCLLEFGNISEHQRLCLFLFWRFWRTRTFWLRPGKE